MECRVCEKDIQTFSGLNDIEIKKRIEKGQINTISKTPSRTMWQMVRANFFNIFTAINLILASIVLVAGSPKNAIFAVVIIVNSFIGISQEMKSKKTLEKLNLINKACAIAIRNGKKVKVPIDQIVKDDIIYLKAGEQILADCEVLFSDELEVDESMITGESDSVYKKQSSQLISGSFVVAGEGICIVKEIGNDTYSSKLSDEARKFKIINSKLQDSINKIIKVLLWLIVPIGICLMITQMIFSNCTYNEAAIGAVSGIVGMIPEGLVLLTSTTFIVSVAKLAKYHTLVQQLSATELLARVDVLCLDKTGTITEGKLELIGIDLLCNKDKTEINKILSCLVNNLPSKNPTQQAILDKMEKAPKVHILEKVPFSSKRKWGAINTKEYGAYYMGAPEILLGNNYAKYKKEIEKRAEQGIRVLILAKSNITNGNISLEYGNQNLEACALILIQDVVRKEAANVLEYFNNEGVDIKVISGDNPITVAATAKRAGVKNADKYIDARNLPIDINELRNEVDKYTVFGRVTPHQKKKIVKALRENEHTVAMTGDGINDVLALKESDCGIAMANGSDATKSVAQLVLMNSDFGSLPKVVAEGRKQINNLETVAELFLSKTVFFVIMAFVFCIMRYPYPILPIQSSLIASLAIGLPSLVLAMLPYEGEMNKEAFLPSILKKSIPNGIVSVVLTTSAFIWDYLSYSQLDRARTIALLVYSGISFVILLRVSFPLNKMKFSVVIGSILIFVIAYILPITRNIFSLVSLSYKELSVTFILSIFSIVCIIGVKGITSKVINYFSKKLR